MKVKCPNCGLELPPMKSPSMLGTLLFGMLYAIYYYWIKGRHCPNCGHGYTSEELKMQGYSDPDNTPKYLILIIAMLYAIGFVMIFSAY